jgi:hypothetical protein
VPTAALDGVGGAAATVDFAVSVLADGAVLGDLVRASASFASRWAFTLAFTLR